MNTGVQIIIALGGSIVGVTVLLTLFFKLVNKVGSGNDPNAKTLKIRGVISEDTRVAVHLGNNTVYENVLLVGFTQADGGCSGGGLPYELNGMTILEHPDGARTMIQSKLIRIIEVPSSADSVIPNG